MMLIERLKEYMRDEFSIHAEKKQVDQQDAELADLECESIRNVSGDTDEEDMIKAKEQELDREIEVVDKAWCAGVVHMMGENEVMASKRAGIGKKIVIDLAYNFLEKNLRQSDKVFGIPREKLLKVGMTYEL